MHGNLNDISVYFAWSAIDRYEKHMVGMRVHVRDPKIAKKYCRALEAGPHQPLPAKPTTPGHLRCISV